jgi:starch phosphorylase
MRILVDLHGMPWRDAWKAVQATFAYTNHTLLPEALETWPVPLMERLLPRHMQIIYLINAIHLSQMSKLPDASGGKIAALSLIDEAHGRRVRMGHLAFLGSHKANGVSKLHSDLMKTTVFRELDSVLPGRITNKTNGITFRRWLKEANPGLTALLMEVAGGKILDEPVHLEKVTAVAPDASFQERFAAQRRANKCALAKLVRQKLGIVLDPDALFDVHIKRIHEYKRQILNILEAIAVYDAIRAQPTRDWIPRVKIFAGKAAASYATAKLIIRLANDVAEIVNSDPTVRGLLKIAFLPNYNVSLAEKIIPAADLSEQISTAGMEASGTGNMKFALNGALTIGTLDGANVEIRERVGADNIFIFGLTAEEVEAHRRQGINGQAAIERSAKLAEVLDAVASGVFSPDEPGRYRGLVDMLRYNDYFLVTADFESYFNCQRSVFRRWRDKRAWWQSAVLNTANMGWFSSDRTISEYAAEIWDVPVRPPGSQ